MTNKPLLELIEWSVSYHPCKYALKNLSVAIQSHIILSIIGNAQAGKSTMLRSINRLHELYPSIKTSGEIRLNGQNIQSFPASIVRRKIGMIFQTPNVFPTMSIRENVLAGYTLNHLSLSKTEKNKLVAKELQTVGIWEDLKNDLHRKPDFLSTGQKQCLCIARSLALQPEILLMDEPASALDFVYADRIEQLIFQLKDQMTILITARNLTQTARFSDYTLYLEDGELVEYNLTPSLLWAPADERTEKYISNQI